MFALLSREVPRAPGMFVIEASGILKVLPTPMEGCMKPRLSPGLFTWLLVLLLLRFDITIS